MHVRILCWLWPLHVRIFFNIEQSMIKYKTRLYMSCGQCIDSIRSLITCTCTIVERDVPLHDLHQCLRGADMLAYT